MIEKVTADPWWMTPDSGPGPDVITLSQMRHLDLFRAPLLLWPIIDMIKNDPNIAQSFRDALQLPFGPADFRQLLRSGNEPLEIGHGYSSDLVDYRAR